MATVEQLHRVTLEATTDGVDQATAKLNQLAEASEGVAVASETTAKATIGVERALNRLQASIDPAFRAQQQMAKGQSILDAALKQGKIDADRYATSLDLLRAKYSAPIPANNNSLVNQIDQLGDRANNLAGQTGNIAAQFQDIGVQLAGGQSPLLIALQQGTQIGAVLGETKGGAAGAVKALGSAFMSVISPVNLLTIGAIAFGGTLIQYLASAIGETETLEERLKTHADLIRSVKDAYGDAAEGLDTYARESATVLDTQLRASMQKLEKDLESMAKKVSRSVMETPKFLPTNPSAGILEVDESTVDQALPKYEKFADAIRKLREEAIDGHPNIRAFREEVSAIAAATDDEDLKKYAGELLKNTEEAAKLEAELARTERALRLTSGAAGEGAGDLKAYGAALKALSEISLPTDPGNRALDQYRKAMAAAGGREDRAAAQSAYDEALKRTAEREAEKAAEKAQREAEAAAKRDAQSWERAVDRIQDQTRALEQQATTYGLGAGEVARYRAEQELLNAAQEANKELTPTLRDQIAALADEAGAAAERMENLREAAEWSDLGKGALKGFISDLRSGKSAADAFANALERIADRLLDMTLDWMFGTGKNPFSGILSMLSGGSGSGAGSSSGAAGAAFAGLGKLPEVIASEIAPIAKQAASTAAKAVTSIAGNGPAAVEAYVREAASLRGINPDIAARVIKAESGFDFDIKGDNGLSYGPMQLYTGGGLGNVALAKGINVRDPSTWREQVDFGMDVVKTDGWRQWYGARNSGIGRWDGIPRGGRQSFNGSGGSDSLSGGLGSDELSNNFDSLAESTGELAPSMREFGTDFSTMSSSFSSATPQLSTNLNSLGQVTSQGGQAVGTALGDTADAVAQGGSGLGQALTQAINSIGQAGGGGGGFLGFLKGLGGGGGGGDLFTGGGSLDWGQYVDGASFLPFANGGVMTSRGSIPLRAYSKGGIATRPQLALFGEGKRPEAYVPLPDGRTIPVTMQGGAGGGVTVSNPIIVNNYSGAEVKQRQERQSDGSMATVLDVVRKDQIRESKRNGTFAKTMGVPFNGRG